MSGTENMAPGRMRDHLSAAGSGTCTTSVGLGPGGSLIATAVEHSRDQDLVLVSIVDNVILLSEAVRLIVGLSMMASMS